MATMVCLDLRFHVIVACVEMLSLWLRSDVAKTPAPDKEQTSLKRPLSTTQDEFGWGRETLDPSREQLQKKKEEKTMQQQQRQRQISSAVSLARFVFR